MQLTSFTEIQHEPGHCAKPSAHTDFRLLIVDDDFDIRQSLTQYFRQSGFHVEVACTAAEAREKIAENTPDLVLLDIMMPGEDGMSLGRCLATSQSFPVIFLSAMVEDRDRIKGLEIGASDYVCKPFNPRELLARVRIALRAAAKHGEAATKSEAHRIYRFDRWTFDTGRRVLTREDGVVCPVSNKEFHLLKAFVERRQLVLSRDRLLELTLRGDAGVFDRTIDSQISRIRRKLERNPRKPQLIKTVHGGGYVFTPDVQVIS